jgi:hypothetical protein
LAKAADITSRPVGRITPSATCSAPVSVQVPSMMSLKQMALLMSSPERKSPPARRAD